jgi:hypothetical protein
MKRITVTALFITYAVILSCSPEPQEPASSAELTTAQQVEVAGFCANLLKAIDRGDLEKARDLAEWRMSVAVKRADEASAGGIEVDAVTPNLQEGLRRVIAYANDAELDPEVALAAERVLSRLQGS